MTSATLSPNSLAQELWQTAWGKPWPYQSSDKITKPTIVADEDVPMVVDSSDDREDNDGENDSSTTPSELEYTFLYNIKSVVRACFGNEKAVGDVLVVRAEYVLLREMLETGYASRTEAIVITGQPGIGELT